MNFILKLLLYSILTSLFFGCKSAEFATRKFANHISNGDCESAIIMSTDLALEKLINSDCAQFGELNFEKIYCETGKKSATCNYTAKSSLYGLETEMVTTLKLVKEKDWKVSNITNNLYKVTGSDDPIAITKLFIKTLAYNKIDVALILSIGEANEKIKKHYSDFKIKRNSDILTIEALEGVSAQNIICKTTERHDNLGVKNYTYHLTKINNQWRISSFFLSYSNNPEEITRAFVTSLAKGDCSIAIENATGNALAAATASKDAGCEAYESKITSQIKCNVMSNTAECSCTEKRENLFDVTFNYDLVKVNNVWKVSNFEKDDEDH